MIFTIHICVQVFDPFTLDGMVPIAALAVNNRSASCMSIDIPEGYLKQIHHEASTRLLGMEYRRVCPPQERVLLDFLLA